MIPGMTWAGLVWKNLLRRPARSGLTITGVALGVALIVALLSITEGVRTTASEILHVGRADFGIFQGGVSDFTRSLLPEALAGQVAREDGVEETSRVFLFVTPVEAEPSFLVFGLDPADFAARRLVVVEGRAAAGEEATLGTRAARTLGLGVGDALPVAGRTFRIAGLHQSGNEFIDSGAVLPLPAVQELAQRPDEVTSIGVTVEPGRRPQDVAAALERRFPGATAITEPGQAVRVDTSSRLILDAGWVVAALALIVGGIGVTNTMAMSVFERFREIGILRAVGWPTRRIAGLIVSEALAICLLALVVGVGLGVLAAHLFTASGSLSALIEPRLTGSVLAWGVAFALGVGLLGAAYPTWRAIRLTPVRALQHE